MSTTFVAVTEGLELMSGGHGILIAAAPWQRQSFVVAAGQSSLIFLGPGREPGR